MFAQPPSLPLGGQNMLSLAESLQNSTNFTTITYQQYISSQNAGIGFMCAFFAGILGILFLIPTPLFAKTLHKKTLWRFENSWIATSFSCLVFWPLVGLFCQAFVPISSLESYFAMTNSTVTSSSPIGSTAAIYQYFDVVDWISVVAAHCVWAVFGWTAWALACDFTSIGFATCLTYVISAFFNVLMYWIAGWDVNSEYYQSLQVKTTVEYMVHTTKGIVYFVGIPVACIAIVLLSVGIVFYEKHTRESRLEDEEASRSGDREHFQKTVNWTEVAKNEVEKKKDGRKLLIFRVVGRFYLGVFLSFLSGVIFFLFELSFLGNATNKSTTLVSTLMAVTKTQLINGVTTTTQAFNLFESRVFIIGISFPISFLFVLVVCCILLVANKTIKKMALISGGFICCGGMNIRAWRVLGLVVSVVQGLCFYGSMLLLLYAQYLYRGRNNFPLVVMAFSAVVTAMVASVSMLEFRHTKVVERVLIPLGWIVSLCALVFLSYSAFPSDSMEGFV